MMRDRVPDSAGQLTRRAFLKRWVALAGGAATLSSLLGACAPSPSPPAPSAPAPSGAAAPPAQAAKPTAAPAAQTKPAGQGGTLVAAGESIGDNFVPSITLQGWAHYWVLNNLYDTLYVVSRDDFKTLAPSLATGYKVSADGLVYTFELRKGVKFHDGTDFNAAAVEFNFMRYLDDKHPYYEAGAIYKNTVLPKVKSIKATDEYTVQFVRETPSMAFVSGLSQSAAGIMSPTAIKKYGAQDAGRYPVGTGPFAFESAQKGNQASLKAFDGYWGGRPALDRVVVRAIPDEQVMSASLMSGEVDITSFLDYKDLDSFRKNSNYEVRVKQAVATGYMGVNQANPTMTDIRVRQAIAHAINKKKIVDVIFYGEADVAGAYLAPPYLGYAPQFVDYYKYDPQASKDLLKTAGVTPEFVIYVMNSSFWPRMGELLQSDFNAVGIKASIEKVDSAKFWGMMSEGKHAAFISDGTANTNDPEEMMEAPFGCENPRSKRWGLCDKQMDDLMYVKQAAEKDPEKRKEIFWQIQKIILDTASHLPLYNPHFATVSNKRVQGYVPLPDRSMFLNTTSIKK